MSLMILAEATEKTDGLNAEQLIPLITIAVLIILMVPFLIWLIRWSLRMVDKQMQFFQRACEHMDATERHMAAVDQTLAQILDQLKRRPLS